MVSTTQSTHKVLKAPRHEAMFQFTIINDLKKVLGVVKTEQCTVVYRSVYNGIRTLGTRGSSSSPPPTLFMPRARTLHRFDPHDRFMPSRRREVRRELPLAVEPLQDQQRTPAASASGGGGPTWPASSLGRPHRPSGGAKLKLGSRPSRAEGRRRSSFGRTCGR